MRDYHPTRRSAGTRAANKGGRHGYQEESRCEASAEEGSEEGEVGRFQIITEHEAAVQESATCCRLILASQPLKTIRRKAGKNEIMASSLMQFFEYAHLPPHLQAVSSKFYDLGAKLDESLPNNAETTALRKLLEAKDCAVRAVLFKEPGQ